MSRTSEGQSQYVLMADNSTSWGSRRSDQLAVKAPIGVVIERYQIVPAASQSL